MAHTRAVDTRQIHLPARTAPRLIGGRKRNRVPAPHVAFDNADELARELGYVPSLRPELDGLVGRLLASGAVMPLHYLGVGMSGFVVCDAHGRGFKAARSSKTARSLVADEAEWLRVASMVPFVREHVARMVRYHADLGVIERECVRAKTASKQGRYRHRTEGDFYDLHRAIETAMLPYGWTAPELKADSYVMTRDRGPVLVDAGMAQRVGTNLARDVVAAHRDASVDPFDRMMARGQLRSEYDRTIPRAVGERLHQRLAPKDNSAVAQRYESRVVYDLGTDEWGNETRTRRIEEHNEPAHVTADHWSDPAVIEARTTAEDLRREHNTLLGAGNFGVAYRVRGRDGAPPKVAKMPAAHNIHGQPWGRDAQRHNILHEAGVANELAALGYTVVPRGVYTEWGGGTPTIVREYGEPVTTLTGEEYGALEAELLSIERDQRWRVEDNLQLYRRADGSVYVGDVGVWQAPSGHTKTWNSYDSGLRHKLEEVQQKYLPGLAERAPGKYPPSEGYEYTLRIPVTTLPDLIGTVELIAELHAQGEARYVRGKNDAFRRKEDTRRATEFLGGLADRERLGIPTPEPLRAAAALAREFRAASNDGAAKANGGRFRTRGRR